jgi:hypothetical protein
MGAVRSLVYKAQMPAIHPHRTALCEYRVANFYRCLALAALAIAAISPQRAVADEGGVSFWLPGQYGNFAAVAPTPGWSLPLMFYNYGGAVSAGRLLPRGHLLSSVGALSGDIERTIKQEAARMATLIQNRMNSGGELGIRINPIRTAPNISDLIALIIRKWKEQGL